MSLSSSRIAAAALSRLEAQGLLPEPIPFKDTGKSALELTLEAIAQAVVEEIQANAEVSTILTQTLAAWMTSGAVAPTDGGAALKASLIAADADGAYSHATGGIK